MTIWILVSGVDTGWVMQTLLLFDGEDPEKVNDHTHISILSVVNQIFGNVYLVQFIIILVLVPSFA